MNKIVRLLAFASAVVVATAALTSCSTVGDSPQSLPILKVGIQEPYSMLLLDIADEQGYLKQAGIGGLEATSFSSIPPLMTSLSKNQTDLGLVTVQSLLNYNPKAVAGAELKIFSSRGVNLVSYMARTGVNIPVAQGNDWLPTVRAWKGKTLGIAASGGIVEKYLKYILTKAGLDPELDVKIVPVGAGAAMQAALQQGLIDVASGSASVVAQVVGSGAGEVVLSSVQMPAEILDTLTSTWVASGKGLSDKPDLYKGIVDAVEKARSYLSDAANKDQVIDIMVKKIGLGQQEAELVYKIDLPSMVNSPVNKDTFDRTMNAYRTTGFYEGPEAAYQDYVSGLAR